MISVSGNGGVYFDSENELLCCLFLVLFTVEMLYYPRHVSSDYIFIKIILLVKIWVGKFFSDYLCSTLGYKRLYNL